MKLQIYLKNYNKRRKKRKRGIHFTPQCITTSAFLPSRFKKYNSTP
jgi:hypothetical protein